MSQTCFFINHVIMSATLRRFIRHNNELFALDAITRLYEIVDGGVNKLVMKAGCEGCEITRPIVHAADVDLLQVIQDWILLPYADTVEWKLLDLRKTLGA